MGANKPMRIGILINSIEIFGGIGKIAVEEVKNLRALGVDAELLVFSDLGAENRYAEISGDIPIVRLAERIPKRFRIRRRIPLFTILEASHFIYPFVLPRYVKDKEWDVIINHESYLTFALLRLKSKRGIRYVQFIWDPISYIVKRVYAKGMLGLANGILYRIGLYLDRLFIRRSEMVMIGGNAHEEFVKGTGKPYRILYPSVYPQESVDCDKDDFVFMMTAWKKGKNPEYVLDLLDRMPELRIRMGGLWLDKDYERSFRAMAKERGLESRLEILGSISEKELNGNLSHARLVLQTNDDRGFGMPALEGAACGCSFIIPEGQGVCDLFSDGKEGFFTKEKDTDAIVSLLEKFSADREFAARMGEAAWNKARSSYSWKIHAEKIIEAVKP